MDFTIGPGFALTLPYVFGDPDGDQTLTCTGVFHASLIMVLVIFK